MSGTTTTATSQAAWTTHDDQAIAIARALAADAVESAGNGHPGTAMSLAPVAYTLFQRYLRHDPSDPAWVGRDRFVLSCGHSSLTLYIQLYLSGYGLEISDLQSFRTWGSLTPGHPEYGHTAGVETTTGPLGQGVANAVGMAMAARRERSLLDPHAPVGESPFDHRIYVLASDGDLQEGVSAEASSLAGHLRLGNLVVIYDANQISIEGDTDLSFSEDVGARYAAYGWHVEHVDAAPDGSVDIDRLSQALDRANAVADQPSFIVLRTVIAWPAPNARGTSASHGAKLGADEVAATKTALGLDPTQNFQVEPSVLDHARTRVASRAREERATWDAKMQAWSTRSPELAPLFERLQAGASPADLDAHLPNFDGVSAMATRKASAAVINALAPHVPELWGGSADLGESNGTDIAGAVSFLPEGHPMGNPSGRQVHFGIREHAMGSIMNGVALHGRSRIFGGTFLVFSDYMRPAVRMAALMGLPVIYVWTHDSIGLGEDGPTHQPVEHVWALRAIPGLSVVRPADATETAAAWRAALHHTTGPIGLVLTRQDVPVIDRTLMASEQVNRGAYVLLDADGPVRVVLIATGSEVQLAVEARERLQSAGIGTRVVSMPCVEWFRAQDDDYRRAVLPPDVTARVSVEAGITPPWAEFVGDAGRSVGLDHFGASAPYKRLYEEFGITVEAVVAAAHESLAASS